MYLQFVELKEKMVKIKCQVEDDDE